MRTYKVLDMSFKNAGSVQALTLSSAMQVAKAMGVIAPILVPLTQFLTHGDSIFSSPFGKIDRTVTELPYQAAVKNQATRPAQKRGNFPPAGKPSFTRTNARR